MIEPTTGTPLYEVQQDAGHVTINEGWFRIAASGRTIVQGVENDPVSISSPSDGDVWIVGTSPVGAFAGHANELALSQGGGWLFLPFQAGHFFASVGNQPFGGPGAGYKADNTGTPTYQPLGAVIP